MKSKKLTTQVFRNASYSLVDISTSNFFRLTTEFLIIFILKPEAIGIIGLINAYIFWIEYISISPESILLRDYKKLAKSPKLLNLAISNLFTFHVCKTFFFLVISFIILRLLNLSWDFSLIVIAFISQKLIGKFNDFLRTIFYVEFQQRLVTIINSLVTISCLLVIIIFLPSFNLAKYSLFLLMYETVLFTFLFAFLHRVLSSKIHLSSHWIRYIHKNLTEFSFFNHLNLLSPSLIHSVTPIFLNLHTNLATLGFYIIALKITKFILIINHHIQKSTILHFSRITNKKLTLGRYFKVYTLISFFQMAIGCLAYYFIIYFQNKPNTILISQLTLQLLLGISIFNLFRPLIASQVVHNFPKTIFFHIYFPAICIATISYFFSIPRWGIWGASICTTLNFLLLSLLIFYFHQSRPSQTHIHYNPLEPQSSQI